MTYSPNRQVELFYYFAKFAGPFPMPEKADPELYYSESDYDDPEYYGEYDDSGEFNSVLVKQTEMPDANMKVLEHDVLHRPDGSNGEREFYGYGHLYGNDENVDKLLSQERVVAENRHHTKHYESQVGLGEKVLQNSIHQHHKTHVNENLPEVQAVNVYKFDPELYAELGYWPYNRIDGDARQLYYAQWLKNHPNKQGKEGKVTGNDIREILVKKLHMNKRNDKYPPTQEVNTVKLYSEFLKRNQLVSHTKQESQPGEGKVHESNQFQDTPKHGEQYFPLWDSSNKKVDVSDSTRKKPKGHHEQEENVHADRNHHTPDDESSDVALAEGEKSEPISIGEIQRLFGSGRHNQPYDAEVLGDIAAFEAFDVSKRTSDRQEGTAGDSKDNSHKHIHTSHMNNYDPSEQKSQNLTHELGNCRVSYFKNKNSCY